MNNHRRAIFQLIAMGRVTPAQAERLLIASDRVQEALWTIVACVGIAYLAAHPQRFLPPSLLRIAHALLHGRLFSLHHAPSLITRIAGGVQ